MSLTDSHIPSKSRAPRERANSPAGPLALSGTVATNADARPGDIQGVKTALWRLGAYGPPDWGITDYPDVAVFQGIKDYQKRKGLAVDGVIEPGGPTEQALNTDLAGPDAPPGPRPTPPRAPRPAGQDPLPGVNVTGSSSIYHDAIERPAPIRVTGTGGGAGEARSELPSTAPAPSAVKVPEGREMDEGNGGMRPLSDSAVDYLARNLQDAFRSNDPDRIRGAVNAISTLPPNDRDRVSQAAELPHRTEPQESKKEVEKDQPQSVEDRINELGRSIYADPARVEERKAKLAKEWRTLVPKAAAGEALSVDEIVAARKRDGHLPESVKNWGKAVLAFGSQADKTALRDRLVALYHADSDSFYALPNDVYAWTIDAKDHGVKFADTRALNHSVFQVGKKELASDLADTASGAIDFASFVLEVFADQKLPAPETVKRAIRSGSNKSRSAMHHLVEGVGEIPGHHEGHPRLDVGRKGADIAQVFALAATQQWLLLFGKGAAETYGRNLRKLQEKGAPLDEARKLAAINTGLYGVIEGTLSGAKQLLPHDAKEALGEWLADAGTGILTSEVYEMVEKELDTTRAAKAWAELPERRR